MVPEPVIQPLASSAIMDTPQTADPEVEIVPVGKDVSEKDGDDAAA